GLVVILLSHPGLGPAEEGPPCFRVEADGLVKILDGFFVFASLLPDPPPELKRIRVLRVELDGLRVVLDGPVVVLFGRPETGPVEESQPILRVEDNGYVAIVD